MIRDDESVLLGPHDAVLPPSAHDSNRRLDRRADHVGELLARQHQRNERAVIAALTDVVRELQEEARQSPFDAAAGELGQTIGQLDETMGQPHQKSPDH